MDKKICRLCLQTISGDYVAIKQSFNDILNMNMNISKEAVKCIDCADNLEVFLKFKSACDYMKDRTDLKEDINLITITEEDHLISPKESIKCCFCTKPSEREGLTSLNESKEHTFLMNVLKEHIPKLNLHITEELLTCDTCLDGLQSVSSFLVNCSDVEQKITEYTEIKGTDDKGQIDLEDVQQLIIDPTIKLEIDSKDVTELKEECDQFQEECTVQAEIKHEEEMDNPELFIKTEEIYIKSEAGNCNSMIDQEKIMEIDLDTDFDLQNKENTTLTIAMDMDMNLENETNKTMCNIKKNTLYDYRKGKKRKIHLSRKVNRYIGCIKRKKGYNKNYKSATANTSASTSVSSNASVINNEIEVEVEQKTDEYKIEGRRIVDILEFINELKLIGDHNAVSGCTLSNMIVQKEERNGFESRIYFKCNMCNVIKSVRTNRGANKSAVVGIMNVGLGYSHTSQVFSALDIPCMSSTAYNKLQNEICDAREATALKSMKEAGQEEYQLAVDNGDVV